MMIHRPIRAQSAPLAGSPSNSTTALDIQRTLLEVLAAHDRLVQSLNTCELDQHKDQLTAEFEQQKKSLHTRIAKLTTDLTKTREQLCRQTQMDDAQAKELRKSLKAQVERLTRLNDSVARTVAKREQVSTHQIEMMIQRKSIQSRLTAVRKSLDAPGGCNREPGELGGINRFLMVAERTTNPRATRELQTLIRNAVLDWTDAHPACARLATALIDPETLKTLTDCLRDDTILRAVAPGGSATDAQADTKITEAVARTLASRLKKPPAITPVVTALIVGVVLVARTMFALRDTLAMLPEAADISELLVWLEIGYEMTERVADLRKESVEVTFEHQLTATYLDQGTTLLTTYQEVFANFQAQEKWLREATQLHKKALALLSDSFTVSTAHAIGRPTLRRIELFADSYAQYSRRQGPTLASERILNTIKVRHQGLAAFSVLEAGLLALCITLLTAVWKVGCRKWQYRLVQRETRPLAERIVASYRRLDHVRAVTAAAPGVREVLRQSAAEEPALYSTTRQSVLDTLRTTRDRLQARQQQALHPVETAIRTQQSRLSEIDARLAEHADQLEKLDALLPKKREDQNELTKSVRAAEDALAKHMHQEITSRAARESLALGVETEILQVTLEQEKSSYLAALETLRRQYQDSNEEVERQRRRIAELESSPSFEAARQQASHHITVTALERARARHVGLDLAALESRVKQGEFTGEAGRIVTGPVDRASSYFLEAHLLMAIMDATQQAPSYAAFRGDASELEQTVHHSRPLGVVLQINDTGQPASFEARSSRICFGRGQDGVVRIRHIYPER